MSNAIRSAVKREPPTAQPDAGPQACLALRWVDLHLLIFGVLFIAIVLLLSGGLLEAVERLRALGGRRPRPVRRDPVDGTRPA